MLRIILLVGIGGLLGSVARYFLSDYLSKTFISAFPWGTWAVNIVGCLLIGLFFGLSERFDWVSPEMRIFLTTGFCGGFTTFSAFAFENLVLLESSSYVTFAVYSVSSFAIGLLATFAGVFLARI